MEATHEDIAGPAALGQCVLLQVRSAANCNPTGASWITCVVTALFAAVKNTYLEQIICSQLAAGSMPVCVDAQEAPADAGQMRLSSASSLSRSEMLVAPSASINSSREPLAACIPTLTA